MNSVGKRLAHLRKSILRVNQIDLANRMGVSQGALSEMEGDKRGIPMEALGKLVEYSKQDIRFSIEWLLTGEGEIIIPENGGALTNEQKELLMLFDHLDDKQKYAVKDFISYQFNHPRSGGRSSSFPPHKKGSSGGGSIA